MVVKKLITEDIIRDGNCYNRAVTAIVYGNQNQNVVLHKSLSDYINTQRMLASSADSESLKWFVADIHKDGSWAGKIAILATANYLQRPVQVYHVSNISSPLTYSPEQLPTHQLSPARVAFYKPGHFRSVFKRHISSEVILDDDNRNALNC